MTKQDQETVMEMLKDADGETLQHIINSIGMEYQMLRQLIMTSPTYLIEDLIEEKMLHEDFDEAIEGSEELNDEEAEEWEDFWWKEDDDTATIPEDFFVDDNQ